MSQLYILLVNKLRVKDKETWSRLRHTAKRQVEKVLAPECYMEKTEGCY